MIAIAALTVVVATGAAGRPAPAGAQPSRCAPGDLGCALAEHLENSLAPPTTATPPPPSSTSSSTPAGDLPASGDGSVEASAGDATPAELASAGSGVPSVPVGQALELPPLTIPDFGRPAAAAATAAVAALPLRSEVGDALTGLPAPPAAGRTAPLAPLVAVVVPLLLVVVSLVVRRGRRPVAATA